MFMTLAPAAPDLSPPERPGGFSWRYLDLVDENGDGAVLIWGFALPFLSPPADEPAALHPFLNLALYRGGRDVFYHLEEIDPGEVDRVEHGWRFGENILQSWCVEGRSRVEARLRLPVPAEDRRAEVHVTAEARAVRPVERGEGPHRWSPIGIPGRGRVVLEIGPEIAMDLSGRSYHDENHSQLPLGVLGIGAWSWGRVAEPEGDAVYYVLWDEAGERVWARRLFAPFEGELREEVPASVSARGRVGGRWGLSAPRELALEGIEGDPTRFQAGAPVDQSSFYLRFPLRTGRGVGWGERVRPAAIGSWWMAPLVRTCVAGPGARSSLLPLFSGPREGRARRLVRGVVA